MASSGKNLMVVRNLKPADPSSGPFTINAIFNGSFTMNEHIEKATQGLMQMCDEVKTFAQGSVDANLKSVTAAAKGWDESSRNVGQLMQENISRAMNAGKSVTEIKSLRDFFTMQQEFAKDCLDLWMSSATRFSEISARTAKDIVEPVAQHTNDSISRLMQKARATA